jgi:hypothetical protein
MSIKELFILLGYEQTRKSALIPPMTAPAAKQNSAASAFSQLLNPLDLPRQTPRLQIVVFHRKRSRSSS